MMLECGHELEYGGEYTFIYDGSCDNCGSDQHIGRVFMAYIGENQGMHLFRLENPFSCLSCKGMLTHINIACGGINVTKEMQKSERI
jgi:hypothetical protein